MYKKLNFIFFLLIIIAISCKKEEKNGIAEKQFSVSFNLSDFKIGDTTFEKKIGLNRTSSVPEPFSILHYLVFDSGKKLIRKSSQNSSDINFGHFSDNLPSGSYTAYFIGGEADLKLSGSGVGSSVQNFGFYYTNFSDYIIWKETFYKKVPLVVAGTDINQTVSLDRIVGQIELHLLDQIPEDIKSIEMRIDAEKMSFNLATEKTPGYPESNFSSVNKTLSASDRIEGNFRMQIFTRCIDDPFSVTIWAQNTSGKTVFSKTIPNVVCEINKKTILNGYLFKNSGGIIVNLDSSWEAPINISF